MGALIAEFLGEPLALEKIKVWAEAKGWKIEGCSEGGDVLRLVLDRAVEEYDAHLVELASFLDAAHLSLGGRPPLFRTFLSSSPDCSATSAAGCRSISIGGKEITLRANVAFGTGYHPSTRGCMDALLHLGREGALEGRRLLDVGTGSGILSLVALALGCGSVVAFDTDGQAVEEARINLCHNGYGDAILFHGGVEAVRKDAFDLVVANLAPAVMSRLLPSLMSPLKRGGYLLLSGTMGGLLDELERVASGRFQPVGTWLHEGWETVLCRELVSGNHQE